MSKVETLIQSEMTFLLKKTFKMVIKRVTETVNLETGSETLLLNKFPTILDG